MLEKISESPLDRKYIKPVNVKGNQPWIFTRRTYAGAEIPVFWSSDVNRWLIGKAPDTGKDWGQKEKRCQRVRWIDGITKAMNMYLGKLHQMVKHREACHATVHGVKKCWTGLGDWKQQQLMHVSQVVLVVRNLPAKQKLWKTWACSLGWENFLEEGIATHSSIFAQRVPLTESLAGCNP